MMPRPAPVRQEGHRSGQLAGLCGLAAVVLFVVGSALWALEMPKPGTPATEVAVFYRERSTGVVIGGHLSLIAFAAWVVFGAGVRQELTDADEKSDLLANTAFGGLCLGLAAGVVAEAANMVGGLRAGDDTLTSELAYAVFEIAQIFGTTGSGLGIGVFAVATAMGARRTGHLLPRWSAELVGLAGIVLLTPLSRLLIAELSAVVLIAVTLTISVPLVRGRRRLLRKDQRAN